MSYSGHLQAWSFGSFDKESLSMIVINELLKNWKDFEVIGPNLCLFILLLMEEKRSGYNLRRLPSQSQEIHHLLNFFVNIIRLSNFLSKT